MKVLIISHNPMSTKHSIGKTLLSLFSEFKREELCQLYIHTGLPERDVCSSFFRVTDKDVLRGVVTRKVAGKTVEATLPEEAPQEVRTEFYKKTYGNAKNRQPHRELLRDLMWALSPWYNKKLRDWVAQEKPTCIFAAIGSGTFLYKMALKIAKDFNLPLFTYVCDDFYSLKTPRTLLGPLWKANIVRQTKKLLGRSAAIVSICQELSDYYQQEFNRPAHTVMTGTNYQVAQAPAVREEVKTIRYFGKVTLNRYKSIADICRAIDRLNAQQGQHYAVEIFCGEPDRETTAEFADIQCAKFCGFISGQEFENTFFSSHALLHIEAFDAPSVDRAKYSVSTKIADSLASGIPFFAYGPREVASIGHLLRHQCAVVATAKEELPEKLTELFTDSRLRATLGEKQLQTAAQYHDPHKVSQQLYSLLNGGAL